MKLTQILILFFMFVCFCNLSAQSTAQDIESLLEFDAISYAQAARFILDAAGTFSTSNNSEAYQYAERQRLLPFTTSAHSQARLDGISLMIMRAFDIKGGIFYSLFKNSHYAYRELVYKEIIPSGSMPNMKVSGEYFLLIIDRVLAVYEEEIAPEIEPEEITGTQEEQ